MWHKGPESETWETVQIIHQTKIKQNVYNAPAILEACLSPEWKTVFWKVSFLAKWSQIHVAGHQENVSKPCLALTKSSNTLHFKFICKDAENWHLPSSWPASGTKAPAAATTSVAPRNADLNLVLWEQSPPYRPCPFKLASHHCSQPPYASGDPTPANASPHSKRYPAPPPWQPSQSRQGVLRPSLVTPPHLNPRDRCPTRLPTPGPQPIPGPLPRHRWPSNYLTLAGQKLSGSGPAAGCMALDPTAFGETLPSTLIPLPHGVLSPKQWRPHQPPLPCEERTTGEATCRRLCQQNSARLAPAFPRPWCLGLLRNQ
jgi:hypothetical protein